MKQPTETNGSLESLTIRKLVDLYNSYGPARRLKTWKGRKADLIARVRIAAKQSTPESVICRESANVPSQEAAILRCQENARGLIQSAQLLLDQGGLLSAAYHLAVLGIEEVGKASILRIGQINRLIRREDALEQKLDDHYQKLFWAFFLPSFSANRISPEELRNAQSLARRMHAKRLDALYVSHVEQDPLSDISRCEVETTVRLAEARLAMEEAVSAEPPEAARLEQLQWLLETIADDEQKKVIFSKSSLGRLQENTDLLEWIAWLREIFDRQEQESRELAERELARQQPDEGEASKEKWRIKYRLVCVSHSVRQKPLNWWNGIASWIKLNAGDKKKRELIVEIRLPKAVSINALWYAGYGETRRFLLALNIGTVGFFWWYALNRENKFYESILDVENDAKVEVRQQNKYLHIDWGRRALDEQDLGNVALCYRYLPGQQASEAEQRPFGEYLTALAFLAKTDLHLYLTANACGLFFRCLRDSMKLYGDMADDERFSDAFDRNVSWLIKKSADRVEFVELANLLEDAEEERDYSALTLDKVLQTKAICDAYLIKKFRQKAEEDDTARTEEFE